MSDILKDIRDPERPESLEELLVLTEESVVVKKLSDTLLHAIGNISILWTSSFAGVLIEIRGPSYLN